jgi:dTDP-4-dehydrorhamnose reductase
MLPSQNRSVNRPLLIIGGDGQLGQVLARLGRAEQQEVISTSRRPGADLFLDLATQPAEWPLPPSPDAAVICAGVTSLEACRKDPAGTQRINVDQTLALIERLTAQGTFVVFLSTNLVYDGTRPHRRADEPPCPRTEYGAQKARVEAALQKLGSAAAVVRLTKVVHPDWPLLTSWRSALQQQRIIEPFLDFRCAPVGLAAAAQVILRVASDRRAGLWQVSGERDISYAEIAARLIERERWNPELLRPRSGRGLLAEELPEHTTLESSHTRQELGLDWPDVTATIESLFRK